MKEIITQVHREQALDALHQAALELLEAVYNIRGNALDVERAKEIVNKRIEAVTAAVTKIHSL